MLPGNPVQRLALVVAIIAGVFLVGALAGGEYPIAAAALAAAAGALWFRQSDRARRAPAPRPPGTDAHPHLLAVLYALIAGLTVLIVALLLGSAWITTVSSAVIVAVATGVAIARHLRS